MATLPAEHGYVVYGSELSLFTAKLEAALRFYGAEHVRVAKSPEVGSEIEARSGTHQVPVLHTPENWMIADTTPLIDLLDGRFPRRRLFPPGTLGVLVHVLEEFFDEWVARTMVHYRWHYPDSARFASERMAAGNPDAARRVREWGPRACRATGTDSSAQRAAAEAEYVRLLDAMETQLASTGFLLGDRPTAVDCIVLGGLRAHTHMDPDPKKVVAGYPAVIDWCTRRADAWDGSGELAPFPHSTGFARYALTETATRYLPVLTANRAAFADGAKAFRCETYGEEVSYLCRAYPVRSAEMLAGRITRLTDPETREVCSWLDTSGLGALAGAA